MKESLFILSAAIALCVAHAAVLAQYPGGPSVYRPNMDIPPNWQPGPGRTWPIRPSGPVPPDNPFLRNNQGRPLNAPGPHGIIPPEPQISGIIDQGQNANSGVPAQVPPSLVMQLTPPVVPNIHPPFEPVKLPLVPPAGHEPFAAPSWPHWPWVAASVFVLCLLALLLRDYVARKHTVR